MKIPRRVLRSDLVGRVFLILGLILLFFSNFSDLKIGPAIPTLFLTASLFLTAKNKASNQVRDSHEKLNLPLIGLLAIGLFCSSLLVVQFLISVKWNEIYFFSPDIITGLFAWKNGFSSYGLLLTLSFSITLLALLIADWAIQARGDLS